MGALVGAIFEGAGGLAVTALKWLIGTKSGRITLLVLVVLAGLGAWTWHVYDKAIAEQQAKDIAAELKATQAESDRRDAELKKARVYAEKLVAKNAALEKRDAANLQKLRRLSAAAGLDRRKCLDDRGTQWLRDLDTGRSPSGAGAVEPAG